VQISQTLKEDRGRRDSGGDDFLSDLQDDGGSRGGILHSGLQDDSGNGCWDDEGGRRRAVTLTQRGDNGPGMRASTPVQHRVGGSGRRRGGTTTSNGWRCYSLPRTGARTTTLQPPWTEAALGRGWQRHCMVEPWKALCGSLKCLHRAMCCVGCPMDRVARTSIGALCGPWK
jgi:hypothetical protein